MLFTEKQDAIVADVYKNLSKQNCKCKRYAMPGNVTESNATRLSWGIAGDEKKCGWLEIHPTRKVNANSTRNDSARCPHIKLPQLMQAASDPSHFLCLIHRG